MDQANLSVQPAVERMFGWFERHPEYQALASEHADRTAAEGAFVRVDHVAVDRCVPMPSGSCSSRLEVERKEKRRAVWPFHWGSPVLSVVILAFSFEEGAMAPSGDIRSRRRGCTRIHAKRQGRASVITVATIFALAIPRLASALIARNAARGCAVLDALGQPGGGRKQDDLRLGRSRCQPRGSPNRYDRSAAFMRP
jgi:hypothetical protein